eukprot:COSAG02_NODE_244_length_27402_cov_41.050397_19_plen_89_part_00
MCVAAEIRAANAQLADLYRHGMHHHGEVTRTRDTDSAVCEVIMDVDLIGGDISPHGEYLKTPTQSTRAISGETSAQADRYNAEFWFAT